MKQQICVAIKITKISWWRKPFIIIINFILYPLVKMGEDKQLNMSEEKKTSIRELQEKIEILNTQVDKLIKIFGLTRACKDNILDPDFDGMYGDDGYGIAGDDSKIPVTRKDFNLLLDYLGIKLKAEEEKTIPAKFIKKTKKK